MGENTSDNPESPRDDLTIGGRGQRSTNRPRPAPRPVPAQFGLRGLLWFMVACSAYFAQLAIRARVLDSRDGLPLLSSVSTVAVGWLLLAAFYVRIRFRRALVIHCFVPGLILVCALSTRWLQSSRCCSRCHCPTLAKSRTSFGS